MNTQHRDRSRYSKLRREALYESRKCVRCRQDNPRYPKKKCEPCAKLEYERAKASGRKLKILEQGKCLACETPHDGVTQICRKCSDRYSRAAKKSHRKKVFNGLCRMDGCVAKQKPGAKTCQYHADLNRQKDSEDKASAFNSYGGKCVKCGYSDFDALCIDHVFDDGKLERRKIGKGADMYRHLKKLGYPQDRYQLLCFSCNMVKEKRKRAEHAKAGPSVQCARRLRQQVIEEYGGKCTQCSEEDSERLCIDHVNNDGAIQRRKIKGGFYWWLKKHGFPKDRYQLLCFNCNQKKMIKKIKESLC